ncbi:MAG TPA: hypothetical protein VF311_12290 [Terriglobales bacterium]
MKSAILLVLLTAVAGPQSTRVAAVPLQLPSGILPRTERQIVTGTLIVYDWSTRYYMEGARVERFIFQDSNNARRLMRVVLLWHPADNRRILPNQFYKPGKQWRLTLSTDAPYDFVREYCAIADTPTFFTEVGNGKKVELPRYVSPTVLPPDVDLATNFRNAIANRPH